MKKIEPLLMSADAPVDGRMISWARAILILPILSLEPGVWLPEQPYTQSSNDGLSSTGRDGAF
jgi:hypothetical protein